MFLGPSARVENERQAGAVREAVNVGEALLWCQVEPAITARRQRGATDGCRYLNKHIRNSSASPRPDFDALWLVL
jgi:hypothetical protein